MTSSIHEGGDYGCIVERNLCVYREIYVAKYTFSQKAKWRIINVSLDLICQITTKRENSSPEGNFFTY